MGAFDHLLTGSAGTQEDSTPKKGAFSQLLPDAAGAITAVAKKGKGKPVTAYEKEAERMPVSDQFLSGVGGALTRPYVGVRQMLGKESQSSVDDYRDSMDALNNTGAGVAGDFVGSAMPVAAATALPGGNTVIGAALSGGLSGATSPTKEGESRAWNTGLGAAGGVLGQMAANTVGVVNRPFRPVLTAEQAALARKAQDMGISLNAAQLTGSKPLRWIDSALDNLPSTAEDQATKKTAQRAAWQKAVLGTFGENAESATPDVLSAAKERIGKAFNDISGRNSVTLDPQALDAIRSASQRNNMVGPLASGKVDAVADYLNNLAGTQQNLIGANGLQVMPSQSLTGPQYQNIRSILTRNADSAFRSGDSQLGAGLKEIRDALDDAATRSVSPDDAAAWANARREYKFLKTTQKAVDPVSGDISPKKLINEVARKDPNGVYYGAGDQTFPDLARIGKQFIAENLPDSGTAQRSWYMNMLQNPSGVLGGAVGAMSGGPIGSLIGYGLGSVTPMAAEKALWNPSGYFTRGLLDVSPATARIANAATLGIPAGLLQVSQ